MHGSDTPSTDIAYDRHADGIPIMLHPHGMWKYISGTVKHTVGGLIYTIFNGRNKRFKHCFREFSRSIIF